MRVRVRVGWVGWAVREGRRGGGREREGGEGGREGGRGREEREGEGERGRETERSVCVRGE